MDYFGDSSDYDSNLDSDYVTESDSAADDSDITSHTSSTSLSPIDGIAEDDDGQSLHTNDTDVESWYEDSSISGDLPQSLGESSVDVASAPVTNVLADRQPDRKEPWLHCQACDNLDFVGVLKCRGSIHEEDEGVGYPFRASLPPSTAWRPLRHVQRAFAQGHALCLHPLVREGMLTPRSYSGIITLVSV